MLTVAAAAARMTQAILIKYEANLWQLSRINWSCFSAQRTKGGARGKHSAVKHNFIIAA